jgi:putative ABC transport system permease protein
VTVPLAYNLNNLMARKVTTLLAAGGIALVVLIFMSVLMLAHGYQKTLIGTGSDDNAIVLRNGATSELVSSVDREQASIIKTQPEVATNPSGAPVGAAELIVIVSLPKRSNGQTSNVVVRGVTPDSMTMRPVKITQGRMWQPGLSEVIAGNLISEKYSGCGVGETFRMGGREWKVVGTFDASGTGFESEVWGDSDQVMAAIRRNSFSSVTVKLRDPGALASLKEKLEKDPRFNVQVKSERAFYEEQSRSIALFIYFLGLFVTVVFSIAAVLAAMLTMFSTISARTAEIGTLRALGFQRRSILFSFVVESALLGIAGGLLGVIPGLGLQYVSFSTTNWTSFSEVAWHLSLNGWILAGGMGFALAMGLLGGFVPALRAARLSVVDALREA